MKNWINWLRSEKFTERTIEEHVKSLSLIERWAIENDLDVEQLSYTEVLSYIQFEQAKELGEQTINNRLNTLSKYYDFLVIGMYRLDNPVKRLRVKETTKSKYANTIPFERLEGIYQAYLNESSFREHKGRIAHQRNKVVLGLMIYQALNTSTLKKLEVQYINLEKGTIYIPSSKKSNKRTLMLQSHQILPLHTYLLKTREELEVTGHRLFSENLTSQINSMFKYIQKSYPDLKNADQIRNSIVMHWLKLYKIREVQYLAGHKYISTTEAFQQDDVDGLQNVLDRFHPL